MIDQLFYRIAKYLWWIFMAISIGILFAVFTGCSNEKRELAAANAYAGSEALSKMARPELSQAAAVVLEGVKFFIRAAVGGVELPDPTTTADAIIEDPQKYRDEGAAALKDAALGWAAWIGGGLMTAVLLAFGVMKLLPGTAGWAGNLAYNILANKAERKAKEQEESLRAGFVTLVKTVENAPPELSAPVKKFVAEKIMPKVPGLGAVIEAVKDQVKA